MKTIIEITNQEVFSDNVVSVDTDDLRSTDFYNGIRNNFCATGNIQIERKNGEVYEAQGEHGQNDYEETFGFILKTEEE